MSLTPSFFFHYWRPLLFLFLILAVGCFSKNEIAGNYQAVGIEAHGQVDTFLELKTNGDGYWKSGGEEIPFSWNTKGGELRINTKGGGVIVGHLAKDTIRLTLPGERTMLFRKIP